MAPARFILYGLLLLVSCQGLYAQDTVTSLPGGDSVFVNGKYLLAPGDVISVTVFGEPDISDDSVRIPISGVYNYPLLGEISLDNETVSSLADKFESRLRAGFLSDPKVSVNIVSYRPVIVTGIVENAGTIEYQEDTYGGMGRHGGGAFSGKDPSKVDRSAAYAARWVAKNLVKAGLAKRCEVQVAYAIGVAEPVSVRVEAFGTSPHSERDLERLVRKHFDLTPRGIITSLDLLRPIYRATSYHGHFGREDQGFPWEATDKAEALARDAAR